MSLTLKSLMETISHLLLDIEGTTCPVSFVAETLFPYASHHFASFLGTHGHETAVRELVDDLINHWHQDPDPRAPHFDPLLTTSKQERGEADAEPERIIPYLQWLVSVDRKITALKDLQGMIWEEGYAKQDLHGPLFEDVPPALNALYRQGLVLAVYSSGSVRAQQLLYGHTQAGNLVPLFQHWFDTRIGRKQEPASYQRISELMATSPEAILFISDATSELEAASRAGLQVLFSQRPGNPQQDPGPYASLASFSALHGYR
jgi:enolase-phosphatase E1